MTIEMIEKQHRERQRQLGHPVPPEKPNVPTTEQQRRMRMSPGEKAMTGGVLVVLLPLLLGAVFIAYKVAAWVFVSPERQVTPAEEAAYQARMANLAAFEARQQALWSRPSASITAEELAAEIGKCREAIKAADQTPYAWMFEDYDADRALHDVRTSEFPSVRFTGQVRHEFPNKVMLAEYRCNFKGSGYSDFSRTNERFMDNYLPE